MFGPIITLTTDFAEDYFAGVMHGVIARVNREARVIDITHAVPLGEIRAGAFAMLAACGYFPEGTVHVAVVDPGVGSGRKILCARTERYLFLAPDNGILSWILTREEPLAIYAVENDAFFLEHVSATFHGRDIFAPVAAHLSLGVKPEELGPAISPDDVVRIDFPEPQTGENGVLEGEILYVDRFGNCITNIAAEKLSGAEPEAVRVEVGSLRLDGLKTSYADAPAGAALALIGSSGFLEIAISRRNAARRFAIEVGDNVKITSQTP